MFESLFLFFAIVLTAASVTASVRGRALGWAVPVWFLVSLAATELAPWLLVSQLVLLLLGIVVGDSDSGALVWGQFFLALSSLSLLPVIARHFDAAPVLERSLAAGLGDDFAQRIPLARRHKLTQAIDSSAWSRPFAFKRPGVQVHRNIAYAECGERNLLDIYTPMTQGTERPVLLQIHGGAWLLGHKAEQALPLLHHMASLGWVVVSINYRLSPKATFPDHIIDVKKAIAWVRDSITEWGGDPRFIAVTGGSAGGHLASLAALSANYADWQPGFESADTALQAAMPLYGAYDLADRHAIRHHTAIDGPILERLMKTTKEQNPALYDAASPITWVSENAPPFFVVQGSNDTLVWAEESRRFAAALSDVAHHEVAYAELPGAQHSFDTFHSPRTAHFLNAAALWLEWAYADWLSRQPRTASATEDDALEN